jgi:hypothetical protein
MDLFNQVLDISLPTLIMVERRKAIQRLWRCAENVSLSGAGDEGSI